MENVSVMFELSEAFNAVSLRNACILYILEKYDKLSIMPGYVRLPFSAAFLFRLLCGAISELL